MSEPLILSYVGRTAIITMNNPPANIWTPESLVELEKVVRSLNRDKHVIALVIASNSEKFFCAGADLKRFDGISADEAQVFADHFGAAFEALSEFEGLTIAAINGYAMGGGLEVALACDLRIAENRAIMALPEAGVGLLPCAGGTQNLTRLVGEAWAKRMILCGEKIDAGQALEIGLVEEVVLSGAALEKALELAGMATRQSPDALKACKQLIQMGRKEFHSSILPEERRKFVKLFDGQNQQEGVRAFLEKREPQWVID